MIKKTRLRAAAAAWSLLIAQVCDRKHFADHELE